MKYAWDKIEAGPTLTDLLLSPTFRWPMKVKEVCIFQQGASFPRCPRCGITMEYEYQRFCKTCGQRLDWSEYDDAKLLLYARLTAAENTTMITAGVSQLVPNTVSIIFSNTLSATQLIPFVFNYNIPNIIPPNTLQHYDIIAVVVLLAVESYSPHIAFSIFHDIQREL